VLGELLGRVVVGKQAQRGGVKKHWPSVGIAQGVANMKEHGDQMLHQSCIRSSHRIDLSLAINKRRSQQPRLRERDGIP
jgi:hypothetical protein